MTRLEQALQLKLDLFRDCLCPDTPCAGDFPSLLEGNRAVERVLSQALGSELSQMDSFQREQGRP